MVLRQRMALALLRVVALAILLFCIFRPVLVVKAAVSQQNVVGILIDDSRSMQLRDENGSPHKDYDDVQIAPANVLVQFVSYVGVPGVGQSQQAVTVGEGEAWIFTDGKLVKGKWIRPDPKQPAVYTDASAYRCIATNSGGSATSNEAALTVQLLPPVITEHPSSTSVTEGQAVSFACAATGTWIELNASPYRFVMDWRLWKYAKSKGVKCVINCDAHRFEHAGFLRLGAEVARKGWLTKADVMNTLPLGKLMAELAKKRNRK